MQCLSGLFGSFVAEVEGDKHDDALGDVLGISAEVDELHAVGEYAQNENRNNCFPKRALAAFQRHTGEHAGNDACKLDAGTGAGVGGTGARGQQNGGDTDQDAGAGEDQNFDLRYIQTGEFGRFGVIADGVDLTSDVGAVPSARVLFS